MQSHGINEKVKVHHDDRDRVDGDHPAAPCTWSCNWNIEQNIKK